MMRGRISWIRAGVLDRAPQKEDTPSPTLEEKSLDSGDVRIVTGELGTEIKWKVQTPCFSSLLRAVHFMQDAKPPFILRFHAFGWFEEVCREAWTAIQRVEEILARGDRHFFSRAFVQNADPHAARLSPMMRQALETHVADEDYTVEVVLDETTHSFVVEKVGHKSAIGRVWGTITSSFPCQPTSKYGDAVSEAYEHVLKTGKPHYDQVLAALRLPDNQVHWVPYHRVVLPKVREDGIPAVAIVSEIARVEIKVL
jgi:hypothetical protein